MPHEAPSHEGSDLNAPFEGPTLRRALRRAMRAVATAQVLGQFISLAALACLYRLLVPADFGLVAMVLPLLMLLRLLTTFGLNVATVQRRELSPQQVSALFWMNLALGLVAALATLAAAPAVAWFYRDARLQGITLALAGTSLVAALGAQHQALLERRLRLDRLAAIRITAQTLAGVAAVGSALAGAGVWALVVQQYVELAVLAAGPWWIEPWRPMPPRRQSGMGELVRFGGFFSGSTLMFFLTGYADKILIGRYLGEAALGSYSQAFNLMMRPVYLLTTPLAGVMLPALSRAAGHPVQYRRMTLGFFRLVGMITIPAGVGLAITAPDVMLVLGGPQWAEAGVLLRVLGLSVSVQGLINIAGSVFTSSGHTRAMFLAATSMAAVLCVAFALAILWSRAPGSFGPKLWEGESRDVGTSDSGHNDPVRSDSVRSDPVRSDSVRSDSEGTDSEGTDSGPGGSGPIDSGSGDPNSGDRAKWGARAMALAYSGSLLLVIAVPYLVYCFRTVGIVPRLLLARLRPAILATAGMAVAVLFLRAALFHWGPPPALLRLVVQVALGVAIYVWLSRSQWGWFGRQWRLLISAEKPVRGQ